MGRQRNRWKTKWAKRDKQRRGTGRRRGRRGPRGGRLRAIWSNGGVREGRQKHPMATVVFCNYMESVTRQPRLRLKYWSVIFEVIFSGAGEV